jgi:hypothetical protein
VGFLVDRLDVLVYRCITVQVYRNIQEKIMLPFKTYSIEDLDPEVYGETLKIWNRNKYRHELITALEVLDGGKWFEVDTQVFLSHYSATDTLRTWVSMLNKKYPDRKYFTRVDKGTRNIWVGRLK